MKKIKATIVICLCCIGFYKAQVYDNKSGEISATQWEYDIFTTDFSTSCKKTEDFLSKNNCIILKQNETKFTHTYLFRTPNRTVSQADSLLKSIGYVSNKELKSFNNTIQLSEAKIQLEYLEKKKSEYEKMQIKIDSVKSAKYYEHWEKTRNIEKEIFDSKKRIKQMESVDSFCVFSVKIKDEVTSPNYSKVNFIHMPGLEYTYLMIEEKVIPNSVLDLKRDPYEQYYGFGGKTPEVKKAAKPLRMKTLVSRNE